MWKTCEIETFSYLKFSFHIWNRNIFTCEIPNWHVKWIGSKFHMWNRSISPTGNIYFTCKMEHSLTKIDFTIKFSFHMWNWNNSHMKYYFLMWTCTWNFCKGILHITRKQNKIEYPYKLQGILLDGTHCERDLGVWTTGNLTSSKHVLAHCSQANELVGYVRRTTWNIYSFNARRTLYLGLVRSQLGFVTQVWAPQSVNLIIRVKRIQNRLTKYTLDHSFLGSKTYSEGLLVSKLLPLCYWYEHLDILYFFKANPDSSLT